MTNSLLHILCLKLVQKCNSKQILSIDGYLATLNELTAVTYLARSEMIELVYGGLI